jgi:hypothetical protein
MRANCVQNLGLVPFGRRSYIDRDANARRTLPCRGGKIPGAGKKSRCATAMFILFDLAEEMLEKARQAELEDGKRKS